MRRAPAALAAVFTVSLSMVQAIQSPTPAPASAPTTPPKPLVPAAANSIAENPDAFYGQNVTVMAAVDRIVSPTSFTVDQDARKPASGDVLVLADVLNAPLELNAYVTVIGEVVRHEGKPAIKAASVLTSAGIDLAKRLPPPMSPEEAEFDKVMKRVNPAFGDIRKAVAAAGGDKAQENAAILEQAFADTEAFFKKRDKADAVKWAADARAQAEILEQAIGAGRWDEAKAAAGTLQQSCSSCHRVYRQRLDDGTYRIR